MMIKKQKIVAILPAYKASKTLLLFLKKFPENLFEEIILVDDCSPDQTLQIAKKLKGVSVYQTFRNLGYGGNLKMCLSIALEHGADIIMEIHPDNEYETDGVIPAIQKVKEGAKLVLGNRFITDKHILKRGMFIWKYPPILFLNILDNLLLGTHLGDLHQGFRVYTKELLEKINFRSNSNNYLFSFEIIVQTIFRQLLIAEVPVGTNYSGRKRGASFKACVVYSLGTFRVLYLFFLAKKGLLSRIFNKPQRSVDCPSCRLAYLVEHYPLKFNRKYNFYFCKICNTGFINPVPENIGIFYPFNYWHSGGLIGIIREKFFRFIQNNRRKKWLSEYLTKGAILDVGAGEGSFVMLLNKNYNVTGIEPLFSEVKNISIQKRDFLKWRTRRIFDAIVFWESLEHTPNPQKYLQKAADLLKDNGFLFIEYPRYDCLQSKIFRDYWFHLDLPRHLSHLTKSGLSFMLNRANLKPIQEKPIFALDYAPAGFFISLMRVLKIPGFNLVKEKPTKILLISLSPIFLLSLILELIFFAFRQSPIHLVVATKLPFKPKQRKKIID